MGHTEEVHLLLQDAQLQAGAADAKGLTALHKAAFKGHTSVVQLLMDAKAPVDAAAANGDTPLHKAATKGHTAVVQLLLAAQAVMNVAGAGGATPMYLATVGGHTEVVQLLLAAPQLTTKALKGAARAAAAAGHAELASMMLKALLSRQKPAAAVALVRQQSVAAEVLRQWQAAKGRVKELGARLPELQQLLIGILTAHKQLQAAASDIRGSAVKAAVGSAGGHAGGSVDSCEGVVGERQQRTRAGLAGAVRPREQVFEEAEEDEEAEQPPAKKRKVDRREAAS
jgi:ankyrin repeat protein